MVRPGQAEQYADILTRVKVWEAEPSIGVLDGFAAEVEAYERIKD